MYFSMVWSWTLTLCSANIVEFDILYMRIKLAAKFQIKTKSFLSAVHKDSPGRRDDQICELSSNIFEIKRNTEHYHTDLLTFSYMQLPTTTRAHMQKVNFVSVSIGHKMYFFKFRMKHYFSHIYTNVWSKLPWNCSESGRSIFVKKRMLHSDRSDFLYF